jgi:hypothetical protein
MDNGDTTPNREPSPADQSAGSPLWYTPQQLVAHARQSRVAVTARQIEEWHKDGLLPEPVRTKLPEQGRGRPPYQYPEPAPEAVIWLGTHRRFISGSDVTRFWMWMEGFSYVQVEHRAVVLDQLQRMWREMQQEVPSLPDIAELADHEITDEQREVVLDEMDANVTAPMLATGRWTEQTVSLASVGAAFLGILPPAWLAETQADEAPHAAALLVDEATELMSMVQAQLPAVLRVAQLGTVYGVVSQNQVSWPSLRAGWLGFTPEALQVLAPVLLQTRAFQDRPLAKTRADVLRLMKYDPVSLVALAAAFTGAMAALPPAVRQAVAHEEATTQA